MKASDQQQGMRADKGPLKIGLMGHLIADYPSREESLKIIDAMADAGVRVIEIQIPFSEPMADGPVFMLANHKAVEMGVGYQESVELMNLASAKHPGIDFVFMTYLNVVYKRGYERFVADSIEAGARGVILPDLPIEHGKSFEAACNKGGIDWIRLIAPNTSDDRMEKVLSNASGLVYVVARTGVTGAGSSFEQSLEHLLSRVRRHTSVPLAVGFGVKSVKHIQQLKGKADFAIVGTKAFEVHRDEGVQGALKFWQSLQQGAR